MIDIEVLREFCLQLPGVTEDTPFGPDVLVFRVGGKIFALTNLEKRPLTVSLKCDPDRAINLRERYPSVVPGYHMNKKHWNTVNFEAGEMSVPELLELTRHSYELVNLSLPKNKRF